MAADLGQRYDSYRDMHEQTQYGSLFFNEGAIKTEQSRDLKRFVAINGSGQLNLPSQKGYCFVFNHYQSSNGNSKSHIYKWKISKSRGDQVSVETGQGTYSPASEPWSSRLPDLCIESLRDVTRVAIEFSSDDGDYFNANISFDIKI